jgi:hypothetical protein
VKLVNLYVQLQQMKKTILPIAILLLMLGALATGCSSSKKGFCGCPNQHGFVGYK